MPWRGEPVARAAVTAVIAGVAILIAGFIAGAMYAVAAGAAILVAAIAAYVAVALRTLAQPAVERSSAAIARALSITLVALLVTALLGAAIVGSVLASSAAFAVLAISHALLGIGAWLSVLVSGVSARTFGPMLGARSRSTALHVASGSGLLFGPVIAAAGAPFSIIVLRMGIVIAALGALTYAADTLDIVARATTPQRPVHAFVLASVVWLVIAAFAALSSAWGAPFTALAIVCALAGWVGQMVNAHLHHLGIRVVITLVRGDEDETRPWEVTDQRLSWLAFALAQCGVAGLALSMASGSGIAIEVGAVCGVLSVAAIGANVVQARARLSRIPIVL